MAKVKSSEIPHYELLCLISNKFSETEVEPIRARISKLITDQGGKITNEEYWGKRKLAYQIDGFRHGYYQLVEFDLEGRKLNEVTNRIRLSSDILRHQVVKKRLLTAAEIEADAKIAAKIAAKRKEAAAAETAKEEAKKPAAEDKRAELKDLDEDLDKIIDASNML